MFLEDFFAFCAFVIAVITGVCGLIFSIGTMVYYMGAKPACEQYGRLTGSEISTQFFGASCLVKYQGRWVDYDVAVNKKQEIKVTQ